MEPTGHNIEANRPNGTFSFLRQISDLLALAAVTIENQKERIRELEKLATTDELTGLVNRRGFYDVFIRELDKANRYPFHGGLLVMIDIDNFKGINDRYGHSAGDAALQAMARSLRSKIRVMDVAARLGGDEFVLLLSGADRIETAHRAQILAWQLSQLKFDWHGDPVHVRASLGLKSYGPGDRADDIFDQADSAMYAAKAGRKESAGTFVQAV
ncbi:MAG: GGDEF domain-containing protein [Alphaproteobacteria bacterium]|nr:GGDEF domain-containing protein [Alphaproteobacteria bacterium]